MISGVILLSVNAASAFFTALQILQSLLIADYRQALAFQGDANAAQRIILPCYRPLFTALIIAYIILSCFQVLSVFTSGRDPSSLFFFDLIRIYDLCILAIFSIVPAMLIQKSVSRKGFWRTFNNIFPYWITGLLLLLFLLLFTSKMPYELILSLEVIYVILVSIPPISLSAGILLGFIRCRVRLGSVSNRNAVELLLTYSSLYTVGLIAGISSNVRAYDSNRIAYEAISLYLVVISVILNTIFPFALYRGLLADTKFWRGLGKHNQGGLSIDAATDFRVTRPTAHSIGFNIASTSFQQMMSDISEICLDFAYVQIDRLIGHGATSEVFCGRYNNLLVAIKISTPPEITPEVLNVFGAEAKICAVLRHKNIVTFHGICVRPPQIGMVFELCEGGNLRSHLQKHPKIWTRNFKIRACWHCAEAVAYLHSKGFIHRDLKAENFMVTRKMIVKLGDFGETTRKRNEDSTRTHKMTILGSVTHMAPELIAKVEYYTESVDVFALAMTFLEIWTGIDDPYPKLNTFQIYDAVMNGTRPELPSDAPEALIHVITQAWHSDYKRRPTADQIASELAILLSEMTGTKIIRETSNEISPKRGMKNMFEVITETTDYTPREVIDPLNNSGYYVARMLIKAKKMLGIGDDNIDDDEPIHQQSKRTEMGNRRSQINQLSSIDLNMSSVHSNSGGSRSDSIISPASFVDLESEHRNTSIGNRTNRSISYTISPLNPLFNSEFASETVSSTSSALIAVSDSMRVSPNASSNDGNHTDGNHTDGSHTDIDIETVSNTTMVINPICSLSVKGTSVTTTTTTEDTKTSPVEE